MKNHVEQASSFNMEDNESSSPNKGKDIDVVGSDSDIDCKDINNACTTNMERDDKLSASNKGKDIAITSSISNPELKIEMTSKILAQLNDKMKELSSKQNRAHCCIYRVPKSLPNVNWKAYTPLGPLHCEIKRIQAMQNHKWRCFREFIEQDGMNKEKIRDLVVIIQNKEKYIRFCYSEKFNQINSCDFIEMILLDAVFIVEFLKEYKHPKNFEPKMMFDIKEDLILLENQLPFSIIWSIYSEINRDFQDVHATWISFLDLVTDAFGKNTGGSFLNCVTYSQIEQSVNGSKHFTDLCRHASQGRSEVSGHPRQLFGQHNIYKGVLRIPQLEVDHNFERLVRNIMAMEQCLYEREAYICSYIKFMDHLIDSAGDVGLLVEKGIILHWLGDDAAVSNMINNSCKNMPLQEPLEKELQEIHPGCIVADMFPWAADSAANLEFLGYNFAACAGECKVSQRFVLPDFPGEEAEEIRSRAKKLREIAREAAEEEELRRRLEIL
uniref:Uncharacterized protein n=1 Tax=Salix viminalis TaxID=40686 RepID=A0A6N2LBC3_SALVM